MSGPLGLIAGQGRLPRIVAARAGAQGVLVRDLAGWPSGLAGAEPFRLERFGSVLQDFRAAGVREVCLAGAVGRPGFDPAALDGPTRALAPRLEAALVAGDDGALRAVLALIEAAGFVVRAAQDLAPELLPPPGIPTRARPGERDAADAARGAAVLAALGAADVGQGCVVAGGQVLAVEALPGTDWMLESLGGAGAFAARAETAEAGEVAAWAAALAPARPSGWPGGGLLVKAPKPGQDRRVDLPTIGPGTVARAAEAGLAGIVVEAGGVLVLCPERVVALCDAAGLFLWLRAAPGP